MRHFYLAGDTTSELGLDSLRLESPSSDYFGCGQMHHCQQEAGLHSATFDALDASEGDFT